MLADKHARQQAELRRCIEEAAQQVVSAEELFKLRDEVTHWMSKSDALADANTELRCVRHPHTHTHTHAQTTPYLPGAHTNLTASPVSPAHTHKLLQCGETLTVLYVCMCVSGSVFVSSS